MDSRTFFTWSFITVYQVHPWVILYFLTEGFIFAGPFVIFQSLGWIKPKLRGKLLFLLGLGALQGGIGWWMVKSGLNDKPDYQARPRVSTYRLNIHLNCAILIYSMLLWNGLTLVRKPQEKFVTPEIGKSFKKMRGLSIGLLHLVAINIITGAAVAGIDAGKVFNTWPLMNDQVVPGGLFKREPWISNFFENNVLV